MAHEDLSELLGAKQELRQQVWDRLQDAGVGRFPGVRHRISNFVGAESAAEQLRATSVWRAATTVKANPDSPQWPVRQRALEDGKLVFMAVPRLADPEPFFVLDPNNLVDTPRRSSSIAGAFRSADTVVVDQMQPVDLVVTGCVAVDTDGVRLGKGGGFSDLEYAIASQAGVIGPNTLVATTVHDLQVFSPGQIPSTQHDMRVDLIATPDGVVQTLHRQPRCGQIVWEELDDRKITSIPLLQRLRDRQVPR